jgi:hypothetical protein
MDRKASEVLKDLSWERTAGEFLEALKKSVV